MQSENIINTLNKSLTSETDDQIFSEFCARVQTYIDGQKWIKKPYLLSPPICSQYGWKCIKTDLLECVTCGAKLSACESKIGNYESYKECLQKILNNLKDSHGKHCPWPVTPCPENFVKMILMPKEEAMSQFLKRVELSLPFQTSFPKIKDSILTDLGFSEHQILSLCKIAKIKTEEASQLGKSIVPLSATGWIIRKEEESEKYILKCNHCLRSVWCGSFSLLHSDDSQNKSKESHNKDNTDILNSTPENGICKHSAENKQDLEEPPTKKKRSSIVINNSPSKEQIRNVRSLLEKWIDVA